MALAAGAESLVVRTMRTRLEAETLLRAFGRWAQTKQTLLIVQLLQRFAVSLF